MSRETAVNLRIRAPRCREVAQMVSAAAQRQGLLDYARDLEEEANRLAQAAQAPGSRGM